MAAGLVEDPAEHPYSGHRELLGRVKAPLIAVDEVLSEYGETLRAARARYVRSLRAEREAEWAGENPGALPWWGRERDRSLTPEAPEAWVDELGRSTGLERAPMRAADFATRCCAIPDVGAARIAGAAQDRETSRLRYPLGALAIERWGVRAKSLGDLLGRRPEVVTRWAARGAERRCQDEDFRNAYEALDQALAADPRTVTPPHQQRT